MKKKFTFIITCVGGILSSEFLKRIKYNSKFDLKIIGVDNNKDANGKYFCDSFFKVPLGNDKKYFLAIKGIIKKFNVDYVLPTSDEEALALSDKEMEIKKLGCKLLCSPKKVLKIISNKISAYEYLGRKNKYVPFYKKIKNFEQMKKDIPKILKKYNSIVFKPVSERGSRGVFIISNKKKKKNIVTRETLIDLDEFISKKKEEFKNFFPALIMQELKKPVHDLDLLSNKGKSILVIPRKRVSSEDPNKGHMIIKNKILKEMGEMLIEKFNLSWLHDCDVMFGYDNKPYLLEINPRPSGSSAIPIAAGYNLIDYIINLDHGISPKLKIVKNFKIIPYQSLIKK